MKSPGNKRASSVDGGQEESMADIMCAMDDAAATLKPQPLQRVRNPHVDDLLAAQNQWRPPADRNNPKAEADKLGMPYKPQRKTWNGVSCGVSKDFSSSGKLPVKMLDVLEQERSVQPLRRYEKFSKTPLRDRARYKFHAQSEPLPEPDKSLLNAQHSVWTEQHDKQRQEHLYPVFHRSEKLRSSTSEFAIPSSDNIPAMLVLEDVRKEQSKSDSHVDQLRPWKSQNRFGQDLRKTHPWKWAEGGAERRELGKTLQTLRKSGSAKVFGATTSPGQNSFFVSRSGASPSTTQATFGATRGGFMRRAESTADADMRVSVRSFSAACLVSF